MAGSSGGGGHVDPEAVLADAVVHGRPGVTRRGAAYPGRTPLPLGDSILLSRHTFKYALLYSKKQRFWLDLKLIGLSFWITCRGTWEHRGKKF